MYYGYGLDPTMILLIPAILFTMYAQFKVSTTTNKYLKVRAYSGYTGEQVARRILSTNGLDKVNVQVVGGHLSDHYDPRKRTVRLSEDVYYGTSITSISVAAHECGHAIQHAERYAPLTFRSTLVPVVNFASSFSWILILIGFIMTGPFLKFGIILFSITVLFQLVTLPVEFNASSRALNQLEGLGIVSTDERRKSRKVLTAAALTYVAAALTAALQLLRLVLIAQRRD